MEANHLRSGRIKSETSCLTSASPETVDRGNRRSKFVNGNREKAHPSRRDSVIVKLEQATIRFSKLSVPTIHPVCAWSCGHKHAKEHGKEWTLRLLNVGRETGRELVVDERCEGTECGSSTT
jgi:hypothetical protein